EAAELFGREEAAELLVKAAENLRKEVASFLNKEAGLVISNEAANPLTKEEAAELLEKAVAPLREEAAGLLERRAKRLKGEARGLLSAGAAALLDGKARRLGEAAVLLSAETEFLELLDKHLISRIEQSLDVTLEDVVDHLVALKKEAKKEGREFTAQDREKALRKISEAARNPDSPATKALAEKIRSHRLPEWKPIKMGPEFFFSTPDNIRHLPGADQFVQKMGERFPNPGSANSADIELAGKKLVAYIKAGLSMDSFDFDAPIVDVPKAEKAPTYDLSAWRKDADNFMKAWRAEAQATMQQAAQQHGGLKARAEQNKAQRDAKIAEIVAGTSSNSKFRAPPVPPAAPESPKDGREQPAPSNVVAAKLQMEETTEPTVSEKSAAAEDLAVKVANDSKGPTVSQPSNAGSEQNLKGVIRGASPMSADGLRVNNADSVSIESEWGAKQLVISGVQNIRYGIRDDLPQWCEQGATEIKLGLRAYMAGFNAAYDVMGLNSAERRLVKVAYERCQDALKPNVGGGVVYRRHTILTQGICQGLRRGFECCYQAAG
ncbi:hypothetical protein OC187_03160, partial [Anaplasma capra]|nr:hypothetical protein [Anaplasma capra]